MINKKELIQMSEFFRERESEFTSLRHYLPGLWTMGKKGITEISSLGSFSLFPFLLSFFFLRQNSFPSKEILRHQTRKLILKNSIQAPD